MNEVLQRLAKLDDEALVNEVMEKPDAREALGGNLVDLYRDKNSEEIRHVLAEQGMADEKFDGVTSHVKFTPDDIAAIEKSLEDERAVIIWRVRHAIAKLINLNYFRTPENSNKLVQTLTELGDGDLAYHYFETYLDGKALALMKLDSPDVVKKVFGDMHFSPELQRKIATYKMGQDEAGQDYFGSITGELALFNKNLTPEFQNLVLSRGDAISNVAVWSENMDVCRFIKEGAPDKVIELVLYSEGFPQKVFAEIQKNKLLALAYRAKSSEEAQNVLYMNYSSDANTGKVVLDWFKGFEGLKSSKVAQLLKTRFPHDWRKNQSICRLLKKDGEYESPEDEHKKLERFAGHMLAWDTDPRSKEYLKEAMPWFTDEDVVNLKKGLL